MRDSFIKTWDQLIQDSTSLDFKDQQTLFYQGHMPYGVFIITSGIVNLYSEDSTGAKESLQAPLNSPIGLDLLFDQQPYPFTATAQGPVVAFFIHKSSLNKYFTIDSPNQALS